MEITRAQRFAYVLTLLVFLTTLALVLLNVYALDAFLILLVIEFFIVTELTRPRFLAAAWRRHLPIFIMFCTILIGVIVYLRLSALSALQ
ncbi:MAG: hypothetical protein WBZ42_00600 [Halobacteriota archaeon]